MADRPGSPETAPLFAGGGEMGARMRSHDWSTSPLGDPAAWPQSLRTIVDLMIDSRHPMFVAWGPQLAFLYNDAYAPIFGAKHPGALGLPFREVWAEIWDDIWPLIERALAGEATWSEDLHLVMERNGYPEDTWYTFSYSPARDEGGVIAGMFCACTETTAKVRAESALREGEARLRLVQSAGGIGSFDWDLRSGRIFRSPEYLSLHGLPAGSALEGDYSEAWRDRLHPDDRAQVERRFEADIARPGPFEHEYRIVRADTGETRWIVNRGIVAAGPDGRPERLLSAQTDVTGRKHAEEELRESEERFRKITDSAPVPIWVTALDRKRSFVNQSYAGFLGVDYAAALAFDWRSIIHPDDMERLLAESAAGEASLEPFVLEGRYRRGDGEWRWLRSVSQPRWGPDGEHAGFIGVAHDVTDAREAETAVRASEAKLRLITDSLPVLISYVDREGRYRFNNRAYEEWFGRAREEIAGKHMREVLGDAAFERIEPLIARALAGERISAETLLDYKAGGKRHVHLEYAPERNTAGEVTGFYVLVSDIGAAKQAEEALRVASERAEADAAERAAILQQLAEGVIVTDAAGRIGFVNAAAAAIHGVARLDIVPDAYSETYRLFTEDGAPYPNDELPLARAVRDGVAVTDARWRIRRPDGTEVLAIGSAQPIRAADGAQTGAVLTLRDDTARRAAEDALRALNETLEMRVAEETGERMKAEETLRQAQKMEAIGQLTGGIAHDFNNLLTVILSSVDLLKRPGVAPEKRDRYIDAIGDTANRAAALTNQLLAFARRQPLASEAFDIGARLRRMEAMLRTVLGATIDLMIGGDAQVLLVDADPNQLDTAVLNMAVNARDAMPDGGALTIAVAPADDGQWIDVRVTDTGAGIAQGALGAIFEPFYTTKSVGKGTGLGLSQVYGFAKQSGGEVLVVSAIGEGSTFTLRLPRSRRDAVADGAAPQDAAGHSASARILVVEDNREVGEAASRLLEDLGHEVALARDSAEALERVLQSGEQFDLVFSDVIMPGPMDGLGLARLLREQRPGLPVVLTTGYSHSLAEDAAHGFEVLRKPYRADALMRLVARTVRATSDTD